MTTGDSHTAHTANTACQIKYQLIQLLRCRTAPDPSAELILLALDRRPHRKKSVDARTLM
jgi:hypothetical protein